MKIEDLSLAEIVTANPKAATVFESFNLDYCCGGKKKLSEAITDPGKLTSVVNILHLIEKDSETTEGIDFNNMPLNDLVDYIIDVHHKYVKDSIPAISMHLNKVVTKHGDKYPYMKRVQELFEKAADELQKHMIKEERILFPQIKSMAENQSVDPVLFSIEIPIMVMEMEHRNAGETFEEIRKLTNQYTPADDACTTHRLSIDELKMFESDLHRHVHLENNILFPKGIMLEKEFKASRV